VNQQTVYGSQLVPTLQNAPLKGAQDVLGAYAQQILDGDPARRILRARAGREGILPVRNPDPSTSLMPLSAVLASW